MGATQESNLILGAQAHPGAPYDGRTLKPAFDQIEAITPDTLFQPN